MRNALLKILMLAAAGLAAQAEPYYYVASFGSDANPCTKTQPCRTFVKALNTMNSAPGIHGPIMALDSADYSSGGGMFINQPILIDGGEHGAFYTGPDGGPAFTILPGGYVTIRNLTVFT